MLILKDEGYYNTTINWEALEREFIGRDVYLAAFKLTKNLQKTLINIEPIRVKLVKLKDGTSIHCFGYQYYGAKTGKLLSKKIRMNISRLNKATFALFSTLTEAEEYYKNEQVVGRKSQQDLLDNIKADMERVW
jgi:hypothetical protein